MLEVLFEVVGEFLIQMLGEVLLQMGFDTLAAPFQRSSNVWLAALGYASYGAIMGGLSLLLFPHNLVPPAWRVVNLIVAPLMAGSLLALWGAWQAKRHEVTLRYDRFVYGFLFAFALGVIRFKFST